MLTRAMREPLPSAPAAPVGSNLARVAQLIVVAATRNDDKRKVMSGHERDIHCKVHLSRRRHCFRLSLNLDRFRAARATMPAPDWPRTGDVISINAAHIGVASFASDL